jgi:hypothetical protein
MCFVIYELNSPFKRCESKKQKITKTFNACLLNRALVVHTHTHKHTQTNTHIHTHIDTQTQLPQSQML